MRHIALWPAHSRWTIPFLTPFLLNCDSSTPVDAPAAAPEVLRAQVSSVELRDAALFVGNLVPGSPGNGVLRYDGAGAFIDMFIAPAGCCMTFGPDENLYALRQMGVHRFNGVTGEHLGVFVPRGHGGLGAPLVPVFGPDGNLYLGDRINHGIRRYDGRTGAFIDEFVPAGSQGMGQGDPQLFVFGPDGHLYVASVATHRILRYDGTTGEFIDAFVQAGAGGLDAPSGLTFGRDGNLYVGSTTTDRIIRYNGVTGEFIDDFVPEGSGGLDVPVGLIFGPDGNLYVASAGSPAGASVLRYNGSTGAFIDAFVPPGRGGITGPRMLEFKTKISMCHRPTASSGPARTIRIGYLSARDHVDHGDTVGPCPED
ncbi:MAG: NHL repeat-containing protein [Gemmatimonadetes bacterium]|nr:NHL repeat-containing protein [Gemmatimonadota bacterium]